VRHIFVKVYIDSFNWFSSILILVLISECEYFRGCLVFWVLLID
jgi:hypothetical protein